MGWIGGPFGYQLLRLIAPRSPGSAAEPHGVADEAELVRCFGAGFAQSIRGKTVLDFGCGPGGQSVAMARLGAAKVIGVDIQEPFLERARDYARECGVSGICDFCQSTADRADMIVSKDAFEHFADPAAILQTMSRLLKPEGYVLASFGPTWLHPYGGHSFSVFPWSHLLFTEAAQLRWRADFKSDGATRFGEVAGGLNQMTIGRFESLVRASPFTIDWLETVPIKGLSWLKTRWLREIGSSVVRCRLSLGD